MSTAERDTIADAAAEIPAEVTTETV